MEQFNFNTPLRLSTLIKEQFNYIDSILFKPFSVAKKGDRHCLFRFWIHHNGRHHAPEKVQLMKESMRADSIDYTNYILKGISDKLSKEADIDVGPEYLKHLSGRLGQAVADFYIALFIGEHSDRISNFNPAMQEDERYPLEGAIDVLVSIRGDSDVTFAVVCGVVEIDLIEERVKEFTMLDSRGWQCDAV